MNNEENGKEHFCNFLLKIYNFFKLKSSKCIQEPQVTMLKQTCKFFLTPKNISYDWEPHGCPCGLQLTYLYLYLFLISRKEKACQAGASHSG